MRKRILLFTIVGGFAVGMLTSGKNGAGAEKQYNCTGAETGLGNLAACGGPSGCHTGSLTPGLTLALELDSAGSATTHYKGGMTYTVKITGTNTTATTLPVFGFQVTCIKGTTSVTTPVNAGTFVSTGLPGNLQYTPAMATFFACNLLEHKFPIPATTGGGATGSTYVQSFQWTAPAAGTGTVSFWGIMNAAIGDTAHSSSSDISNSTKINITEWPSTTAIAAELLRSISLSAFPNPMINTLNLKLDNTLPGSYSVQVFDITGRMVTTENIMVIGTNHVSTINTANWLPGAYHVIVEKDGVRKTLQVVKL